MPNKASKEFWRAFFVKTLMPIRTIRNSKPLMRIRKIGQKIKKFLSFSKVN